MRKYENIRIGRLMILLVVMINTVILKLVYLNNADAGSLLLFSIPILLIALVTLFRDRSSKKLKPRAYEQAI